MTNNNIEAYAEENTDNSIDIEVGKDTYNLKGLGNKKFVQKTNGKNPETMNHVELPAWWANYMNQKVGVGHEAVPELQERLSEGVVAKAGENIWRLMDRDNPQLGNYFVFSEVKVRWVSPKSITCDDDAVYNKETGNRISKTESAYGSSTYTIMNYDEAVKKNDELTKGGKKVRGLKTETK